MKNLLNYKDFYNQHISEQNQNENVKSSNEENIQIVEVTEEGTVAEDRLGNKSIINNIEEDSSPNVTKVEEV